MMNTKDHKNTSKSNVGAKRIQKHKNNRTVCITPHPGPIKKSMNKQRFYGFGAQSVDKHECHLTYPMLACCQDLIDFFN